MSTVIEVLIVIGLVRIILDGLTGRERERGPSLAGFLLGWWLGGRL
jgi:hypothetical protein